MDFPQHGFCDLSSTVDGLGLMIYTSPDWGRSRRNKSAGAASVLKPYVASLSAT